ncbi:hypothetical protein DF021_28470 [Burkholderia stagnalis]|uniref:Uncharacterized protein n=1 Tax=Burkholderia stagnalis TaxID=1503054 RepID=A0ABX9YJ05_9BURK|nr:hypothetical protein DF158_32000 [Burkholderia stagnalis]RQQ61550.1 hypothetical protein DF137_29970 [Burkholderia stagnalis]RQQ62617.1 hypothetical protein DF139_29180 [Burkholderia stagnalis]RQQ76490.1 hypothetical protein DF138_29090 [Burkholderia stagnalis]RQQ82229.1 hypothetical protein DF134_30345 [Burkholderia stagnalis]
MPRIRFRDAIAATRTCPEILADVPPRAPPAVQDLHGNRLYTLLPGGPGRPCGHSLYSRRVRHPV